MVGLMSHYAKFFGAKDVSGHYSSALDSLADPVLLTGEMKNEAWWWETKIRCFMEKPEKFPDSRKIAEIYSDASGEWKNPSCGIGAMVCSQPAVYVTHPWPDLFRNNIPLQNGAKLKNSTVLFEAIGILGGECANPKYLCEKVIQVHTDNTGVFESFQRMYTRDPLIYNVIKAAKDVAIGLNSMLEIKHVKRMSCEGAKASDYLSRGNLSKALPYVQKKIEETQEIPPENFELEQAKMPEVLTDWLENPTLDRSLGDRILTEWKQNGVSVPGYFVENK